MAGETTPIGTPAAAATPSLAPGGRRVADTDPMLRMLHDPNFAKIGEPEKYDNVMAVLERQHPEFAKLDPAYKHLQATTILQRAGLLHPYTMQGPTGGTELRKPLPGAARVMENYVMPGAAAMGGAALGGLGGGLVGGPAGAIVGGAAGAGTGAVASDMASSYINSRFFGRDPVHFARPDVLKDEAVNFALNAASEFIPLGRIVGGLVGAKPLAEGATAAAQQARTMTDQFAERTTQAGALPPQAIEQAQSDIPRQLAPKARGDAIQQQLGRTAEQGAQARALPAQQVGDAALPGDETVARQRAWSDAVFNPMYRASDKLGEAYNSLFGAVKRKPVGDLDALNTSAGSALEFSQTSGFQYQAATKKFLQSVQGLAPAADGGMGAVKHWMQSTLGNSPDEIAGMSERQLQNYAQQYAQDTAARGASGGGATVEQLLAKRSEASALTRSNLPSRDKAALFQTIEGIDSTLEHSGLVDTNKLSSLNKTYGSYKRTFDTGFRRTMATGIEPTEVAGHVFESPQRFQQLWAGATPEEQSTLRQTYADWVLRNGVDKAPGILKQQDQQLVLQKLYAGTPLADPNNWIHLDNDMVKMENVLNTSPQMRTEFEGRMKERIGEIQQTAYQDAITWARANAKTLGPQGEAMAKQAQLAKTPEEGARVVTDYMQRHADEAPIQALMHGVDVKPGSFTQRVKRGLSWYPEIFLATALMGHPSPFAGAGMAMAAPVGVHLLLQKTLQRALRNPDNAAMFWKAISDPSSYQAQRRIARMTGDFLMGDASAATSRMLGTSQAGATQATDDAQTSDN